MVSAKTELVTRAQAVLLLELPSARALDRLIERGAPGPAPGKKGSKRYDVPAIERWREERKKRLAPTLDLSVERAKLARVQRKLTSLKLREARGELVRSRDVADIQRAVAAAVKTELLAVPRRAVLAGLPREHEALMKRLIVDALREVSNIRTIADLTKKASAESEEDDAA